MLLHILKSPQMSTIFASMLPFLETKAGVPFGIARGLSPFEATFFAFLGTSFLVPILLNLFLPVIEICKKTKPFYKFGLWLERRGEKNKKSIQEKYKYFSLFLFVATPLPGTGVYGGCLLAAILGLHKTKSAVMVLLGNLIGCLQIWLLSAGVVALF